MRPNWPKCTGHKRSHVYKVSATAISMTIAACIMGLKILSQLNAARKICVPVRGFSQKFKNPKLLVSAFSQKSKNPKRCRPSLLASLRTFAKICKFSQKSANFHKKLQVFAKIGQIFEKIGKFSQESANFRKNRQIFAKIGKFSQKSANFRKNRDIFAKIGNFFAKIGKFSQQSISLLFSNFRAPGPHAYSRIIFSNFCAFALIN